jgi:hypothetical protein
MLNYNIILFLFKAICRSVHLFSQAVTRKVKVDYVETSKWTRGVGASKGPKTNFAQGAEMAKVDPD